jgi:hypothetical protein
MPVLCGSTGEAKWHARVGWRRACYTLRGATAYRQITSLGTLSWSITRRTPDTPRTQRIAV